MVIIFLKNPRISNLKILFYDQININSYDSGNNSRKQMGGGKLNSIYLLESLKSILDMTLSHREFLGKGLLLRWRKTWSKLPNNKPPEE